MPDPIVVATDLRVAYGSYEAVRGVDLAVEEGELVAVLGTNGAGKTSLLECLEGLRPPSSGSVRVNGHDPYTARLPARRDMGIMLQEGGFAGDLTVHETVQLWSALNTGAGDTAAALAALDLTGRADLAVKQLSGGERRRLDVVLATLKAPGLLFLDEPTTGLDPQARAATWEVVRDLRTAGTTILLTTHYLEEAEQLADRVVVLHEGRIALDGPLPDLVRAAQARIDFRVPAADLPALVGRHEVRDGRVQVRTDALQRDLRTLLDWADANGLELLDLRAGPVSLADVFAGVVDRAATGGLR